MSIANTRLSPRVSVTIRSSPQRGPESATAASHAAAASGLRDLPEQLLVDLDRQGLVAKSERTLACRHGRLALPPDSDGVNLDPERRRRLRRSARIDDTLVVHAVRQQDDHFAFAGSTAQTVRARRDGQPFFCHLLHRRCWSDKQQDKYLSDPEGCSLAQ